MKPSPRTTHRQAWIIRFVGALALMVCCTPGVRAQSACEDVSGTWAVELTLPGTGTSQVTLTLEQTECMVTGLVEGRNRTPLEDGTVEGSTATFTAMATNQADGQGIAIVWEATVEGDEIGGTLSSPLMGTFAFTGTRVDG